MRPTHKILTTLTAQRPHPPRITPFRYNACRDPTVLQRAVRAIKRRRLLSRGRVASRRFQTRLDGSEQHSSTAPPTALTDPASLEVSVAVNCDPSSQIAFLLFFSMEARISCEL